MFTKAVIKPWLLAEKSGKHKLAISAIANINCENIILLKVSRLTIFLMASYYQFSS
ncbi:hypothetical protein PUW59_05375 [Lactobacillus mulieris]|nr:hypothetical protein PUW59_05375 [Lactobacillus mulieris]